MSNSRSVNCNPNTSAIHNTQANLETRPNENRNHQVQSNLPPGPSPSGFAFSQPTYIYDSQTSLQQQPLYENPSFQPNHVAAEGTHAQNHPHTNTFFHPKKKKSSHNTIHQHELAGVVSVLGTGRLAEGCKEKSKHKQIEGVFGLLIGGAMFAESCRSILKERREKREAQKVNQQATNPIHPAPHR